MKIAIPACPSPEVTSLAATAAATHIATAARTLNFVDRDAASGNSVGTEKNASAKGSVRSNLGSAGRRVKAGDNEEHEGRREPQQEDHKT